MKTLIIFILMALSIQGQTSKPKEVSELTKLRAEFVKATEDYKASLGKLVQIYERNVKNAEERLDLSKKLLSEGLIMSAQVEENERRLAQDREKLAESKRQLENADKQIAAVLDEAKLAQEYQKAKVARKRARQRPCLNWDIVMSQRQTANSLSFSYKIVCR